MILIHNVNIHTVTKGLIKNGYVILEKGKIKEVGTADKVNPAEFKGQVISGRNRHLFPGFIDAHSHLGLSESAIGFEGSDTNEATEPLTPELRGIDSFNPMDITVTEALQAGVTMACVGPGSANILGGTFAVVKTHGKRVDDMIIKNPVAMKCAFGENPKRVYNNKGKSPTTRMATAALFREILYKAKQYLAKKEAAGEDMTKMPAYDAKCEALIPVLKKEIPLKAHAHRADDIFTAIRIAKEFDLKMTLEHCTEGHLIVDELLKENYPCIVGPSFGHRSKFELKEKSFNTAKVLSDAGIDIAITTDSPVTPLDTLPLMAALAWKEGMNKDKALEAITINPAKILGLDKSYGSIEKNKVANLVLMDKHVFETNAKVLYVFVDGEVVYKK